MTIFADIAFGCAEKRHLVVEDLVEIQSQKLQMYNVVLFTTFVEVMIYSIALDIKFEYKVNMVLRFKKYYRLFI